jgi:hypothetical protein
VRVAPRLRIIEILFAPTGELARHVVFGTTKVLQTNLGDVDAMQAS